VEIVRALLAANADVNAKAGNGGTALLAASQKGQIEVVRALLAAKATVDARMADGTTALMAASQEGHSDVVQALLAANADVNVKAANGFTALMAATNQGYLEVMRLLIESQPPADGADRIKGDGIILTVQPDQNDLLITSGWPRSLDKVSAYDCTLTIKSFRGGFFSFDSRNTLIEGNGDASGFFFKVAGGGEGIPMIAMLNPNQDRRKSRIVDYVGCEWRFPNDINFTLRGIEFAAESGGRITFERDAVRLMGVRMSGKH
jgi:hypothetical protein